MTFVSPQIIKNGVVFYTEEENGFSASYLAARDKEGRIVSDTELSLLPNMVKGTRNADEWLLRKKSTKRFIDYIKTKPTISILDVGCGNGWFSNLMALNNNKVIGLDINIPELEQAARVFKKENLQFVYGDLFKIDAPFKNQFNIIVLNASVQYFEDFEALLSQLKKFLTANGEIHIIDSPFYDLNEVAHAKKRTEDYYSKLGFPEMAKYYFHHSIDVIKDFKILHRSKNDIWSKFLGRKDIPFPWVCFYNETATNAIKKGFSNIAQDYEALDETSGLVYWMRERIRKNFAKTRIGDNHILEINCGSGIDAVYFAKKGYKVHATDIAEGMVSYIASKIASEKLEGQLACELLSFEDLHTLKGKEFTHVFSNFGGLNCSPLHELKSVFGSFKEVLAPKGRITLVIMPKICIWEFLKILKGDRTAFRRLKKKGVLANIKGEKVRTYYHSAREIKKMLATDFTDFRIENICFLAPTGNHLQFYEKHPFLFKILSSLDTMTNKIPFLRGYGDYYIISAKKKLL